MQRDWRPEQATEIADAIELLLDSLDRRYRGQVGPPSTDFLPSSTGLRALDQVCDGGLWPGTLTVLEATLDAQARSLLYSIGRLANTPRLLAADQIVRAARWLVAGSAGVPAELIRLGALTDDDWGAIIEQLPRLGCQDLLVTEASSIAGIEYVLSQRRCSVLLVDEPERFGPLTEGLFQLAELADSSGLAVLTTAPAQPEQPRWEVENVKRVAVVSHSLGSRAALVTTGGSTGWAAAQIAIEPLTGCASGI